MNIARQEHIEKSKIDFLDVFLQNIDKQGWLGFAFIKNDELKRVKVFSISDSIDDYKKEESIVDGWDFDIVTRSSSFFEQRMKDDHELLFEMAIIEIVIDKEGFFGQIKKNAIEEIINFIPNSRNIKQIEVSLKKALIEAELYKKNSGNLSTIIIFSNVNEMLKLLFLKNFKPFPGYVYGYLYYRDLENVPNGFPQMFESLLESSECIMRTERFAYCFRLLIKL